MPDFRFQSMREHAGWPAWQGYAEPRAQPLNGRLVLAVQPKVEGEGRIDVLLVDPGTADVRRAFSLKGEHPPSSLRLAAGWMAPSVPSLRHC